MSEITLIEKIKQDAATAVAEVKTAGAAEVEGVQRETQAAIDALVESESAALKKQQEQMELVAVSRAKQAGKIALQQAKRNQINQLFSELETELTEQSSDDYVAFFAKYAAQMLPKQVEVTVVEAPANRQAETKQVLDKLSIGGEVESCPSLKAGLIVYTKDGVYDATLARMMSEKRAALEMMIVNKVMA